MNPSPNPLSRPSSPAVTTLGQLHRGQKGRILRVEGSVPEITQRLLEMGLLEGAEVEVVHEAPWSRDPIAVRVRGALIALRRSEAAGIEVQV